MSQKVPAKLDADQVILALMFVAPKLTKSKDGTLVPFVARDQKHAGEPIVDRGDVSKAEAADTDVAVASVQ